MPPYEIRYVKRYELDTEKWNRCIEESTNRLVYGYSFYLDTMSKNWDALIADDYEAIMPLTWNKKWGFKYLYQPPFTQQLGIFSKGELAGDVINGFLQKVAQHFNFAEIFLNYKNSHPGLQPHSNFILNLNREYDSIQGGYKYNLSRSLKLTKKFGFRYNDTVDLQTTLEWYKKQYWPRMKHLEDADFYRFQKLCTAAQERKELLLRAVSDSEGDVLSVALLLRKLDRIYLLQSATSDKGRKMEANYFLIDSVIREHSGTDTVFDFEGSDIPGISHFYRLFGSVDQPYYFYHLNNLPWWLKPFKSRSSPIGLPNQS